MSNGLFASLDDRTVLRLSGADTRTFLQGLVTANVEKLTADHALYAALLTPQGKILFDFFLVQHGDDVWLDCAAATSGELIKRLTFYKLRAAVDIEDMSEALSVAAVWQASEPFGLETAASARTLVGGSVFIDPRFAGAGARIIAPAEELRQIAEANGFEPSTREAYHGHRIRLGLADSVLDIGSGEHFPHECNFDQIGGVDFKKGCFVGQEVVSRTEHRGTARKRFLPVSFETDAPAQGAAISANGKAVGEITSSAGNHALGLVRLDRAQSALDADGVLASDDHPLVLHKPAWARFDVPGATE